MFLHAVSRPFLRKVCSAPSPRRYFTTIHKFHLQPLAPTRVNYDEIIQTQSDVDAIDEDAINVMDVLDSVNLMFHTARKNCRLSPAQLEGLTMNLSRKAVESFDAQRVSNLMFGLHPYLFSTKMVEPLISAALHKISLCEEEMRAQQVGNCIFGLQGMDSTNPTVRKFLPILAERIDSCTEELSPLDFANSLYGLRQLSSRHEEVRQLLHVLMRQLESCHEPLTAQLIGISLQGLGSMYCRHSEALSIIRLLTDKIKQSDCILDGAGLGNIYSLNKLSSDKKEVRELVQALVDKLCHSSGSSERYSPLELASALFGLQQMSAKHDEVLNLFQILATKMEHHDGVFSPDSLELAMRGMRTMSSDLPEVRALLSVIARKMPKNSHQFMPHYFVSIFASLYKKSCEFEEVRVIFQAVTDEMLLSSEPFRMTDINEIWSHVLHHDHSCPEVLNLLKALNLKMKTAIPDSVEISPILLSLRNIPDGPFVQEVFTNVTSRVRAIPPEQVRAREVIMGLSFAGVYSCKSEHVKMVVSTLLDKYDLVNSEDKKFVYVSILTRLDVMGGLVGIGMDDDALTSAYLKFVHSVLISTLSHESSIEMTMDHFTDYLLNLQSMKVVEGTESEKILADFCDILYSELLKLEGSKTDARHVANALFGLQGLLVSPHASSSPSRGPGADMCTYFVKMLKKMFTDNDAEISTLSCQLGMITTVQRIALFDYVCRADLQVLGLAEDMALIMSTLRAKLDTRSRVLKHFRALPRHLSMNRIDTRAMVAGLSETLLDTGKRPFLKCVFTHKECVGVFFPCLHVVRRKHRSVGAVAGYNVEVLIVTGPIDQHTVYLTKMRDEYLRNCHGIVTIRCEITGDERLRQRDVVVSAMQDATLRLYCAPSSP